MQYEIISSESTYMYVHVTCTCIYILGRICLGPHMYVCLYMCKIWSVCTHKNDLTHYV